MYMSLTTGRTKYKFEITKQIFILIRSDPDPNQQAQDADPGPAKWSRSDLTRIHNAAVKNNLVVHFRIRIRQSACLWIQFRDNYQTAVPRSTSS